MRSAIPASRRSATLHRLGRPSCLGRAERTIVRFARCELVYVLAEASTGSSAIRSHRRSVNYGSSFVGVERAASSNKRRFRPTGRRSGYGETVGRGVLPRVPRSSRHVTQDATFSAIAAMQSTTALSLDVFLRTSHPTMPNLVLSGTDRDNLIAYILSLR